MSQFKIWNLSKLENFSLHFITITTYFRWTEDLKDTLFGLWMSIKPTTIKGALLQCFWCSFFLSHLKQKAINTLNCLRQKSGVWDPGGAETNTTDGFIPTKLTDICLTLSDPPARALIAHELTRLGFHQSSVCYWSPVCLSAPPPGCLRSRARPCTRVKLGPSILNMVET